MRKLMVVFVLISMLLCACGKLNNEYEYGIPQESFEIGGITITGDDAIGQWVTDTELTNKVEQLLNDKYGEKFVCEQYVYYEEFSLCMDVEAYPEGREDLRFYVRLTGAWKLEIQFDEYYNALCKEKMIDFVYNGLEQYIDKDDLYVYYYELLESPEVSAEIFRLTPPEIYISVENAEEAEKLNAQMEPIILRIYENIKTQETYFNVHICTDDVKEQGFVRHNQIYYDYSVGVYDGRVSTINETKKYEDEIK